VGSLAEASTPCRCEYRLKPRPAFVGESSQYPDQGLIPALEYPTSDHRSDFLSLTHLSLIYVHPPDDRACPERVIQSQRKYRREGCPALDARRCGG